MVSLMISNGPLNRLNCPKLPIFAHNYQSSESRLTFGPWHPDMELFQTPDNTIKYRFLIHRNIKYRTHQKGDVV